MTETARPRILRRVASRASLAVLLIWSLSLVAPATPATSAEAPDPSLVAVDVNAGGRLGNGAASGLSVTPDGSFVLFMSDAKSLPRTGSPESATGPLMYRRDMGTHEVNLAGGVIPAQGSAPCAPDELGLLPGRLLTPDGRYNVTTVYGGGFCGAHAGPVSRYSQVYVHDNVTGRTRPASVTSGGAYGDNESLYPSVSDNGRFVAYQSASHNFQRGDNRFNASHVYVHDMVTGENRLVDRLPDGAASTTDTGVLLSGNVLSGDGRRIIYIKVGLNGRSYALHLVDLPSGRDRVLASDVGAAQLSRSGRYVTYQGIAASSRPLMLDTVTGQTRPTGSFPNGSAFRTCFTATLDPTDRYATYNCTSAPTAGHLAGYTAIFRKDVTTGQVRRVDATRTAAPMQQEAGAQEQIAGVTSRGDVLFTSSWPGFSPAGAPRFPHVYLRMMPD